MRNEELKKQLKTTIQSNIPDITNRIDFQKIVIEPKPSFFRLNLNLGLKLATVFALLLMFTFGILSTDDGSTTITPITLNANTTSSFSAVSSSVLMDAKTFEANLSTTQVLLSMGMQKNQTMMHDKVALLNPYINMIEVFLMKDELSFSESIESDLPNYEYMLTYQTVDLTGTLQTYRYYFSETLLESDIIISGELIFKNTSYVIEGIFETTSDHEILTIKTYVNSLTKEKDFIETISDKTSDEQVFKYHVYQNGKLEEYSELKLETEGKQVKIKLKYENEQTEDAIEIEAIRIVANDQTKLRVKYEIESNVKDESGIMMIHVEYNELTRTNDYHYDIKNSRGGKDESSGVRHNKNDDDDDYDDDKD